MIRVADYIIEKLLKEGVETAFTVTGRGALFLNDAMAKNKDLNVVCTHHEQGAAFAAIGYAQMKNELGSCIISTGCASTNVITGLLCAWQDSIPCIFISGQNTLKETSRHTKLDIRTYGQQEADIISIVEPITKYAVMIEDAQKAVYEVEKAIYYARHNKKGPVWIDVPLDIQSARIDPESVEHFEPPINNLYDVKVDDIKYVIESINSSERPAVLIGSGIRSGNSIQQLNEFLKKNPMPITYSNSAPDIITQEDSNAIGSVGFMGCSRSGNFTVQNCDLLIVLGNRLSSMTTGNEYSKFAREAKVIVIDIDKVEHQKEGIKIDRLIISNVHEFLEELTKKDIKKTNSEWIQKCIYWKDIFSKIEKKESVDESVDLYYLSEVLSNLLPNNSILATDSGLIEIILPTNISFKKGSRIIHPTSQGAMGFALPAAIGSYFASKKPVVAVIGDGSIMMNIQELQTISYHNIPIKILVINNNAYSIIRRRQKDLFRSRTIGTDSTNGIDCPDFKKVAECFNLKYEKVEKSKHLEGKLNEILSHNDPLICEIKGIDDQNYIEASIARNSKGRFVRRPLEDQCPFIDRSVFLKEMIVEPIDQ